MAKPKQPMRDGRFAPPERTELLIEQSDSLSPLGKSLACMSARQSSIASFPFGRRTREFPSMRPHHHRADAKRLQSGERADTFGWKTGHARIPGARVDVIGASARLNFFRQYAQHVRLRIDRVDLSNKAYSPASGRDLRGTPRINKITAPAPGPWNDRPDHFPLPDS